MQCTSPARHWLAGLLAAVFLPGLSGCLVIEKKTLVMVLPGDSKEIRMYYVFEGLSVLDDKDATLRQATSQIAHLFKDDLSFFMFGIGGNEEWLKPFRFQPLRLFSDARRPRILCADRRVTIVDRDQLAATMNQAVTDFLRRELRNPPAQITEAIKDFREKLRQEHSKRIVEALGGGPLLKIADGLAEMAEKFDEASLKRVKEAADKESYSWLSFSKDTIRLGCPVTLACARRILKDPNTATWLKEVRTMIDPIRLEADGNGLSIIAGEKGKPIRFSYVDPRPHQPKLEAELFREVGKPGPVVIAGMPVTAERLIARFIAEQMGK